MLRASVVQYVGLKHSMRRNPLILLCFFRGVAELLSASDLACDVDHCPVVKVFLTERGFNPSIPQYYLATLFQYPCMSL